MGDPAVCVRGMSPEEVELVSYKGVSAGGIDEREHACTSDRGPVEKYA